MCPGMPNVSSNSGVEIFKNNLGFFSRKGG